LDWECVVSLFPLLSSLNTAITQMLSRLLLFKSSTRSVLAPSPVTRPFSTLPSFPHLALESKGPALWIALARPDVHNAFNEPVIESITKAFQSIDSNKFRCVVLTGSGPSFSAGADLNWMKKMAKYSEADNRADALKMFDMFYAIRTCPLPVISRVNGAALGGGTGLVAACDFSFAVDSAVFGLTEVKLGLIPAVISRFVMDKIGKGSCLRFFLTGERFSATTAGRIGLIQAHFPTVAELDIELQKVIDELAKNSPAAMRECKNLIEHVSTMGLAQSKEYVASMIAQARVSPEGQEGIAAFLEKRKPSYLKSF